MIDKTVMRKVQKHLFCHPLYRWIDNKDSGMNVLVVGDTDYAKSFVDLCLETGQMIDHSLKIFWCIDEESTKEKYLECRPELKNFVSIGGDWSNDKYPPYGYIYFKNNEDYLCDDICDIVRYAFVAGDDDEKNHEIAELFKNAVENNCLSAYVAKDQIQLCLNEESKIEKEEEKYAENLISDVNELERMAFNTHRVWEDKGNFDYRLSKERFREEYNYKASTSFVMSIPYKLHSIGITTCDVLLAADEMDNILKRANADEDVEAMRNIRRLAELEHRRWVIEKVCGGIKRLVNKNGNTEYASCIAKVSIKKTDDDGNVLMHPCIVHSTDEMSLSDTYYSNHDNWDKKSEKDSVLDELDYMSVELHRAMKDVADRICNNRSELDRYINEMESICAVCNDTIKRDFDRYKFCIENVIGRSMTYSAQYDSYERLITKSLEGLDDEIRVNAYDKIIRISRLLFPVIESNQYKDYKKYDIEMIKHIPFILTGEVDVHICTSLGMMSSKYANNNDSFSVVASSTALYATKISYLLINESNLNLSVLASKLKAISNYYEYRGQECYIKIEVFSDEVMDVNNIDEVLKNACTNRYIDGYTIEKYVDDKELIHKIKKCVNELNPNYLDGTNNFTTSQLLNGNIINSLIQDISYFEFDSYNKKFNNCNKCEYLKYTPLLSYLQVEDMFALMNAQDKEYNYLDCADVYKEMWGIFCGDSIGESDFYLCALCWNKICNILKSGGSRNMIIKNQYMDTSNRNQIRVMKKMLREMEKKGYLRRLNFNKSNSIYVEICGERIKKLFAKGGDYLEAYVYYECCKLNWFDDVQTGYKFKWEYDDVTNELDCILTKDYRSILIECKSRKDMNEGYYLTLDSLADHFGIGYKKVLIVITNTNKKGFAGQISRGKQMDIITISSKEELVHIGEKLKEIMLMQ